MRTKSQPPKLSTSSELLLGAAAGALAQVFTIPVSVIATRQQLWTPESSPTGSKQATPSLLQTGHEIVRESGVTGLWTGLRPGLVLTANPAITYGVFERIKSAVLSGSREGDRLGVGESFWIGVGSKAIATVVTYPYIFVSDTVCLLTSKTVTLYHELKRRPKFASKPEQTTTQNEPPRTSPTPRPQRNRPRQTTRRPTSRRPLLPPLRSGPNAARSRSCAPCTATKGSRGGIRVYRRRSSRRRCARVSRKIAQKTTSADSRYPVRQQGSIREVGVGHHCCTDGSAA